MWFLELINNADILIRLIREWNRICIVFVDWYYCRQCGSWSFELENSYTCCGRNCTTHPIAIIRWIGNLGCVEVNTPFGKRIEKLQRWRLKSGSSGVSEAHHHHFETRSKRSSLMSRSQLLCIVIISSVRKMSIEWYYVQDHIQSSEIKAIIIASSSMQHERRLNWIWIIISDLRRACPGPGRIWSSRWRDFFSYGVCDSAMHIGGR